MQSKPLNESVDSEFQQRPGTEPRADFATRAGLKASGGIDRSKLILLAGGLAAAVLFFVFTALVGRSPKRQMTTKQNGQTAQQPKGSVTPVMESVRRPAPENTNGQLGPSDILRTRSSDGTEAAKGKSQFGQKPASGKPPMVGSLGDVPSFADTQQRWEELKMGQQLFDDGYGPIQSLKLISHRGRAQH